VVGVDLRPDMLAAAQGRFATSGLTNVSLREERDEYLLEERIVREGWRWIAHHWRWFCGAEQQGFTFGIRLYAGAERTHLFAEAVFSGVQLSGSLAGTLYDQTAQRLVAVATKEGLTPGGREGGVALNHRIWLGCLM
jgi:hypothetical protein